MNQLFYGDNLDVLRRYIADESVDVVYLDPRFKSENVTGAARLRKFRLGGTKGQKEIRQAAEGLSRLTTGVG